MKVTLSAAMRARDVARPTAQDQKAAEQAAEKAVQAERAGKQNGGTQRDKNRPRDDGGRQAHGGGSRPRRKRR
ncbi:MAG TPA: hypothetical protein VKV33_01420 [Streptosporangiaceae bacterium]|nr:hypothetical protein [Streptosporangiaceae bacterium]